MIKLADDSTVTGNVTSATEIECENHGDEGNRHEKHGADDGPNHVAGDDHGDDASTCTTASLTPGTMVHEAELQGTGAQAVFEKVELLG